MLGEWFFSRKGKGVTEGRVFCRPDPDHSRKGRGGVRVGEEGGREVTRTYIGLIPDFRNHLSQWERSFIGP